MEQKQQNPKRFDDYEVDCNDCQHYWRDTCDGVPIEKKRNCTSFKAARTYDIPEQIKQLREDINSVERYNNRLGIALILVAIGDIIHLCLS